MAVMIVRHKVQDYSTWRRVYDAFAPAQKQGGVTAEAVYQAEGDPNDLTIYHEFSSLAAAKAFAESPELKQAMGSAGVVGAPAIWFGSKV